MMLMSIVALATEPAVIAACGTVGGGIFLKVTEGYLSKRKAVEPIDEDRTEAMAMSILTDDSFGGCTLEFQRSFEQKFIDAGIQTELSKCYDERCETCHPTEIEIDQLLNTATVKIKKQAPEIGTVNDRECSRCKRKFRDMPNRQRKIYTKNGQPMCRHCMKAKEAVVPHGIDRLKSLEAERKRAKEAFEKSRAGKNRTAVVFGRVVPVPGNVPKTAEGYLEYSHFETSIVWSWEVDGRKMIYRQRTAPEMFEEFPLAPREVVSKGVPTTGTIKAGDTWINSGGISSCDPCDTYSFEEECRGWNREFRSQKNHIDELEEKVKMYKNSIISMNELRESLHK